MIETKIGETTYNLRTSWNDVTLEGYCAIVKLKDKPFIERMATYTGIELDKLNSMKVEQFFLLMDLVAFMDEPDLVMAFAVGYESDMSIGEQPYWKVEKCKQLLKDNPNPVTVGAEIVELYTGDKDGEGGIKLGDKPVTEAIGQVAFFLNCWETSLIGSNG